MKRCISIRLRAHQQPGKVRCTLTGKQEIKINATQYNFVVYTELQLPGLGGQVDDLWGQLPLTDQIFHSTLPPTYYLLIDAQLENPTGEIRITPGNSMSPLTGSLELPQPNCDN